VTPERQRLLDYIREHITGEGRAPSYRKMMSDLGYNSTGVVYEMTDRLVRDGHLIRQNGKRSRISLPDMVDLGAVPTEQLQAELARRQRAGFSLGEIGNG
jgi:SOS-response transcriptional repressor LexA